MAGVRVIIRLLRRLAGYVLNKILAIRVATIVKLQAIRFAGREARTLTDKLHANSVQTLTHLA